MINKSIFKVVLNTVSKLPWLKGTIAASNKNMEPGKGFNKPVSNHAFDYLKELDDSEFDKLIALLFKQRGYSISAAEDDNECVDILLKMNGETIFVQYRHWREYEIDVALLEQLDAEMDAQSVRHGIVITTGLFTEDALDYSRAKRLLLINGVDLSLMVGELSAMKDDNVEDEEETKDVSVEEMPELEPLCPICSREMIKRTAKKGKNAGNTFWGCSQFPNCRGVISN